MDEIAERFGIVSKLLFSEHPTAVRLITGKSSDTAEAVTLNSSELRTLGRQAYMLARRLDAKAQS